jgi:hypothetical protein
MESTGQMTEKSSTTEFGATLLLRFPLRASARTDLDLIGGAGFATTTFNPDGADNDTSATAFTVSYGLGVGFWVSPHWQISMSALNPVFVYTKTKVENPGAPPTIPPTETETSSNTLAVIFDPTILAMVHLHF